MSHSVPPDSSLLGRLFPISSELVRFARPDAAIHAAPQLWAQASNDAPLYGLPVDRLYSEEAELHVEMTPLSEEPREIAAAMDDLRMIGAGGHAFWRDPGVALLGVYGEGLAADVGDDTGEIAAGGIRPYGDTFASPFVMNRIRAARLVNFCHGRKRGATSTR